MQQQQQQRRPPATAPVAGGGGGGGAAAATAAGPVAAGGGCDGGCAGGNSSGAGFLSVLPSFPRSVWARAFYAVLELLSAVTVPSSHAAEMAWIWGSCLQSRFLPRHTGVQRVVSGGFLASKNHPWTEASAILLEECKYPRICTKPPSLPIQGMLVVCR